jgi:hypothetical protein
MDEVRLAQRGEATRGREGTVSPEHGAVVQSREALGAAYDYDSAHHHVASLVACHGCRTWVLPIY